MRTASGYSINGDLYVKAPPGGIVKCYDGAYDGRNQWTVNYQMSTNFFTYHQSYVVSTYTSEVTIWGTWMEVLHNGNVIFTIASNEWDPLDSIIPGDSFDFGGFDDNDYLWGFSNNVSASTDAYWGVTLCDTTGCFGGFGDEPSWSLW